MKQTVKTLAILITIGLFSGCESTTTERIEPFDIEANSGYWEEQISKSDFLSTYSNTGESKQTEKLIENLPAVIKHSLVIKDGFLVEYMTFTKDNYTPISKFPIIVERNKITVLHPSGDNEVVSSFYIDRKGQLSHDTQFAFKYINSDFQSDYDIFKNSQARAAVYPCPGLDLCIIACKATHRSLDIPYWMDSICCFWWPDCGGEIE